METEYQFEYVVEGVTIYSSDTGGWVLRESGWAESVFYFPEKTTYLNGFLHFITLQGAVAAVDTKGKVWRITHLPHGVEDGCFIGHSQGCLFYVNANPDDAFTLSIYVLEDYSNEECTFEHSVSALDLFGPRNSQFGRCCSVLSIHPDCNMIFFEAHRVGRNGEEGVAAGVHTALLELGSVLWRREGWGEGGMADRRPPSLLPSLHSCEAQIPAKLQSLSSLRQNGSRGCPPHRSGICSGCPKTFWQG